MNAFGRRPDLGNAISMEDALAMLTVIFVIFMLVLVPLVNLDRVKLKQEHRDRFWDRVAASFSAKKADTARWRPYSLAFDLHSALSVRTAAAGDRSVRYVEALLADSALTIIRHNLYDNTFIALYCQNSGSTKIYRSGSLTWNPGSREWVVFDFDIDYGDRTESLAMEARYRTWFLETSARDG
jgi:hypothetical protein